MRGARAALVFLTRLPGGLLETSDFGRAPAWFGAVGLLVGALQAAIFLAALQLWPPIVAALLAVIAGMLVTGGLHEDGVADSFDGLGSGKPRDQALEIMRDSRIGSHGAIALGMALALRVTCLAAMGLAAPVALIAGQSLSRVAMALALRIGPYARVTGAGTGMTGPFGTEKWAVILTVGVAVGLAGAIEIAAALAGLSGLILLVCLMRGWAMRRFGGVTGDILGAIQIMGEIGFLLGFLACL